MSAEKIIALAEERQLIEPKIAAQLRKQIAAAKNPVRPETIIKALVDKGLITPVQANRLLVDVSTSAPSAPAAAPVAAAPPPKPADELGFADSPEELKPLPPAPAAPAKPSAPAKSPPQRPSTQHPQLQRPPAAVPASPQPQELEPLGPEPVHLEPISSAGDPFGGSASLSSDPFGAPSNVTLMPLGGDGFGGGGPVGQPQQPAVPEIPDKVEAAGWDSPLLLFGSGAVGLLLLFFILLLLWMTRGNAADVFNKADEQYRAGSYSASIEAYDRFVKTFPTDPKASLARVRRHMSMIRQVADGGGNPQQALKAAQVELPKILSEEAFNEARIELVNILPDIADGLVNQAKAVNDTNRREELTKLVDQALELANNPSYLPSSMRTGLQPRIDAINEKLIAARRSIDEDRESQASLDFMVKSAADGKAFEGYQERAKLLARFPGFETNPKLIAATAALSAKERDLVQTTAVELAAATDDPLANQVQKIPAASEGGEAPVPADNVAVFLVKGAVYGIAVKTGKPLWRRFVGAETAVHPFRTEKTPTADVIVTDVRRQEIYRLAAADGKLIWRLPIKEPFFGPTLADERLLATTAAGVILDIDLATGTSSRRTQLPQPAKMAVAVGTRSQLFYQMGAQASLFVLGGNDMQCRETIYVAHRDGALATPPVSVLGNVFVADNAGADYSLIHVLQGNAANGELKSAGEPMRLKGRVVTPPAVHGRRLAYITDLGEILLLEVDAVNKKQPLSIIGKGIAVESDPVAPYALIDGTNFWVGSKRLINYEIQASLQQLAKKWTIYPGDTFVAPPQVFNGVLVHARHRQGSEGVLIEATSADGKRLWQLELATPMAGLFPSNQPGAIGVTRSGRTLRWDASDLRSGVLPTTSPAGRNEIPVSVDRGVPLAKDQWVFHAKQEVDQLLIHSAASAVPKLSPSLGERSSFWKTPTVFQQGILVPQRDGAIRLVRPTDNSDQVLPLFPMLQANATIVWHRPTVSADGESFLAVNSNGNLFRVVVKEKPRPHLAVLLETKLKDRLISPLASTDRTVFVVARREAGDVLQAIDIGTLKVMQEWPQPARLLWGPVTRGQQVLVAFSSGRMLCVNDARQESWSAELPPQMRVAEPVAAANEWLFPTSDGKVLRLSPETGERVGEVLAGEPLGIPLVSVGQQLLAATADGTLLVLPFKAGT